MVLTSLLFKRLQLRQPVIDAVVSYYSNCGVECFPDQLSGCPTETSCAVAEFIVECIDLEDSVLISGLREDLITVLQGYKPGTVLQDDGGHLWYRRAKMLCTRHRFISSVSDGQEKYYKQKYLLTVPLNPQSQVVLEPPDSWVELCAREGMCDKHLDAMSSAWFHTDALRQLAQVYIEHGFLTEDEADIFLSDIPILGETEEEECRVSDQMLDMDSSDPGIVAPRPTQVCLDDLVKTFTESQSRAFHWVEDKFESGEQVLAAIVGPAGTGKSYLLKELAKSKNLVVNKLAPSGVAAHLIGGTTVHHMFALDIEYNSLLEEGTVQTTKLRKCDVLVIDEFSMLDWFLFRTAEGLCRKYGKRGCSCKPWSGRHVTMLGDPAQLPAVSQRDIFSTKLWTKFFILVLREVKCTTDPVLCSILAKIRLGICDEEVTTVLESKLRPRPLSDIDLQRTVVICSTRKECDEINDDCIDMVEGSEIVYDASDTDHHGHPLHEADLERNRERLPDKLVVKVNARVV